MSNLSDTIDRKFVETFDVDEWEVLSHDGWRDVARSNKTIPYEVYEITFDDGTTIKCADDHIFIEDGFTEVFAKDALNKKIISRDGAAKVISIIALGYEENMYDLSVSGDHTYFTNGILSHNTTAIAAAILWLITFNQHYNVACLAHKESQAMEILERVKFAFEFLPRFLKHGVKSWNKGDIALANGSGVFAAATSAGSIRGRSVNCVVGSTKITFVDDYENVFHTYIELLPPVGTFNYKHKDEKLMNNIVYIVYKITNKINGKIYIGFHKTDDIDDGYLGSGKLIKRAIEKYGPDAFHKEILFMYDNSEAALAKEKELVDKDFSLREDTYNISEGGASNIMYGKNNPFYGKKHTKETIDRIQATRAKHGRIVGKLWIPLIDSYGVHHDSFQKYKENSKSTQTQFPSFYSEYKQGHIRYVDDNKHLDKLEEIEKKEKQKAKHRSIIASKKFKGVPKTEEHRRKISEANRGKPSPHTVLTNKNPEKIEKTRQKHLGMKRSPETRAKMSAARKAYFARVKAEKDENANINQ